MNIYRSGFAVLGALALAACGGADGDPEASVQGDEPVAQTTQAVQLSYPLAGYSTTIANTTSPQSRSTGAIRSVNVNANTNYGPCGATFVSKHYAVTAAHCVSHLPITTGNVVIEQYTTSNLNTPAIVLSSSTVSGNWPNWSMGPPLQSGDGYSVTSMTCHVTRRCSTADGGVQACPVQVATPYGSVDIAMLQCPDRNNVNYATTTSASTVNQDVEMFWFNEIVNLTTTPSLTDQYWLHYGMAPSETNRNDNYHYRARLQLFPEQSTGRPRFFNTPLNYKDVANAGNFTNMDVPICHGASGSGVFLNGQNVFLGPVIGGFGQQVTWTDPSNVTHPLLCHRADLTTAGVAISTHVKSIITHTFVTSSLEVLADR